MKGTIIYKMTGSGNDFVFVDGRVSPLASWTSERIKAVCARGTGVGADGLVVLEPGSGPGAVRFNFFNNDGSPAEMCGNGALCATRLAGWLELAPASGMRLETDSGVMETRCIEGEGELAELVLPARAKIATPDIPLAPGETGIWVTRVAVPHVVVCVKDVAAVPLMARGRELRMHPSVAPAGANVNFVSGNGSEWAMRTYERGVEAETLACATGAAACASVLAAKQEVTLPWRVHSASGAILTVSDDGGDAKHPRPRITGQARLLFRAVLEI